MQIKHQGLKQHLSKSLLPVYFLIGPDEYYIDKEAKAIKKAFSLNKEITAKIVTISSSADWDEVKSEVYHYSLFSDNMFLDIRYDKKSIDSAGKKILSDYVKNINPHCLLLIRSPNISIKQLQWISNSEQVMIVSAFPADPQTMKTWINNKLLKNQYKFNKDIIEFIFTTVQGNMSACSQVLQKIYLTYEPGSTLNNEDIMKHLSNQCEFQIHDLSEAWLRGSTIKALQILKHLLLVDNQYSLVLWLLTKEIRTLLQFNQLIQQKISLSEACKQLNIWKYRASFYQTANQRLSETFLHQLLVKAKMVDEYIKTGKNRFASHLLDQITYEFCQGQLI